MLCSTYTGPEQAERVSAGWVASNPDTPGGSATYTYGSGLVTQTDGTGTAYYTRDPSGTLISQRLPSGAVSHYLTDWEGSVVALVDGAANLVARYFYCPTGNPAEPDSGPAALGNPWRFLGLYFEMATKDYLFPDGARVDSNSGNATQLSMGSGVSFGRLRRKGGATLFDCLDAEGEGAPLADCGGGGGGTGLYRAVGQEELSDILRFGDYGTSPSEGGKYFALTEQGAVDFAQSAFNAGQRLFLTRIRVPEWITEAPFGERFFDSGGAGASVYFREDILPLLYEVSDLPELLYPFYVLPLL